MNTNSYFTIEILTSGNLWLRIMNTDGTEQAVTVYYWKNKLPNANRDNYDGSITTTSTAQYISISTGDVIRFYRAETTPWSISSDSGWYNRIGGSAEIKVYGNIASLIGFSETIPAYCFRYLLYQSQIVDASELELPWTTLSDSCFIRLFMGSTKLAKLPYLPATTLANNCYTYMFRGCTALKTIAKMGVQTITCNNAFVEMYALTGIETVTIPKMHFNSGRMTGFMRNCTSLKTVTVDTYDETLPANAYQHLFRGCSGLETVICKAKNFETNTFSDWFLDASATGTFIKDKDTTWPTGNSGIPSGWTVKNSNQYTQFLDFNDTTGVYVKGNQKIVKIYGQNGTVLWEENT